MSPILQHAHIGSVERTGGGAVGAKGDRSVEAGVGRVVHDAVGQNMWQNATDFLDDVPLHVRLGGGVRVEIPLVRALAFQTIKVGLANGDHAGDLEKDGETDKMGTNGRRKTENVIGIELKTMLEEPKGRADGDRATVHSILWEDDTVGVHEVGVASVPAVKAADVFVDLGTVPLRPAVRGEPLAGGRPAGAANYPDTVVGVIHQDKEEVTLVQTGKYEGDDRKVAYRGQSIVVAEGWNRVGFHAGSVGGRAKSMPASHDVVSEVADRAELLARPAVVQVQVEDS